MVGLHARVLIVAKDDILAGPLAEGLDRLGWRTVTARGPYAAIAPESKAKVTPELFAKLAKEYLRGLGFEAKIVHIHTCDEHGAEAIANVVLSGTGTHRHRFKDAITLRRDATGWAVVLPAKFGKSR